MTPEKRIEEELNQPRPYASRAEAAVVSLLHTADLIRRVLERILQSEALTLAQYDLLSILRSGGERGWRASEIQERMVAQVRDFSAEIELLAKKRLLLCHEPAQGETMYRLSAAGRQILKPLDDAVRAACERGFAGLSLRDQAALLDLLDQTRDVFRTLLRPRTP